MIHEDETEQACQHVMLAGSARECNLCSNAICFTCLPKHAVLCQECRADMRTLDALSPEERRAWAVNKYKGNRTSGVDESDLSANGEPGFWERETAEAAMRMGAGETPNEPGFFQQQAAEALSRMSAWPVEPPAPAEPDYSIPSDEEEDGSESSDGPDSVSESPLEEAQ
jgi:hypothetical protein